MPVSVSRIAVASRSFAQKVVFRHCREPLEKILQQLADFLCTAISRPRLAFAFSGLCSEKESTRRRDWRYCAATQVICRALLNRQAESHDRRSTDSERRCLQLNRAALENRDAIVKSV